MKQKPKPLQPAKRPTRRVLHVRAWRKARGLSQERLAELAGVTQGYISHLENNATDWTGATLEALAEAMDCTALDLQTRDPDESETLFGIWDGMSADERAKAAKVLKALKE